MSEQILSDYTVVDFTHVLAGPTCTRMLVEMGANVIKVELPPIGDVSRVLPFIKDGRSAYYVQQNRGKKSVCFDAKTDQGKEIVRELIAGRGLWTDSPQVNFITRCLARRMSRRTRTC